MELCSCAAHAFRFAASEKAVLGLRIPKGVTPREVARLVGPNRKIVAMDVTNQRSNATFTLQGWADYWEQKPRARVSDLYASTR